MESCDVIVVGAGFDGLVAAARLAKSGLNVVVLEKRDSAGGRMAASAMREELSAFCAHPFFDLPSELIASLDLPAHGLSIFRSSAATHIGKDGCFVLYSDENRRRRELERLCARDAQAWQRFQRDVSALYALSGDLLRFGAVPVSRLARRPWQLRSAWKKHLSAFDTDNMREGLRASSRSIADFLDIYFETALIKTQLATLALWGTTQSPFAPTTAMTLPPLVADRQGRRSFGGWQIQGGAQSLINALVACLARAGGRIQYGTEVTDILFRERKAVGVALADGRQIHGRCIVSTLDVKRTILAFFPSDIVSELAPQFSVHPDRQGATAVMRLTLKAVPDMGGFAAHHPACLGSITFADDLFALDEACSAAKDGRLAARLPLKFSIPSLADPTLSPAGSYTGLLSASSVPYRMFDGLWSEQRRQDLAGRMLSQLSEYWPAVHDHLLAHELWLPSDFEERLGIAGGDIMPAPGNFTPDILDMNVSNVFLSSQENVDSLLADMRARVA